MPRFSKAVFEPLVNKTFAVHGMDGRLVEVRLAGITSHDMSPHYESFTLNFVPLEKEEPLPDGSYAMETDGFGPALVFISPTPAGTPDPADYYYESVFNVLREG